MIIYSAIFDYFYYDIFVYDSLLFGNVNCKLEISKHLKLTFCLIPEKQTCITCSVTPQWRYFHSGILNTTKNTSSCIVHIEQNLEQAYTSTII